MVDKDRITIFNLCFQRRSLSYRPPESTGSGILYPRHIVKKSDLAGTFERKSRYMLSRKCPQQLSHLLSVSRHNNNQTIQILPVTFLALQHPSSTITSLIVPRILETLQKAQFSRLLAGTFRLQHLDSRHKINFRRPALPWSISMFLMLMFQTILKMFFSNWDGYQIGLKASHLPPQNLYTKC